MNKTISLIPSILGSLLLIALLSFSFGCSSISEDAVEINESENIFAELINQLENMNWQSNNPNARSSQAIPTFKVTITTLQKMNVVQPAVQDQATVLIATDEAYSKLGITPDNVEEHLELLGLIVFNQTMSGQTIKGRNLAGNSFNNLLSAVSPIPSYLSFEQREDGIYVEDYFNNTAKIIRTDWGALKSTSHFIDNVLVPQF